MVQSRNSVPTPNQVQKVVSLEHLKYAVKDLVDYRNSLLPIQTAKGEEDDRCAMRPSNLDELSGDNGQHRPHKREATHR